MDDTAPDSAVSQAIPISHTMICTRATARQVALAMTRAGLFQPRPIISFAVGCVVLMWVATGDGYPWFGVIGIALLTAFILVTTYVGQVRQARSLFRVGSTVAAGYSPTALRMRTEMADAAHPYAAFQRARVVGEMLLLRRRGGNVHLIVPLELATPEEIAVVEAGVAAPVDPVADSAGDPAGDPDTTDQPPPPEVPAEDERGVLITEELQAAITRATLRHLLAPRRALPLVFMLLVICSAAGWALEHLWVGVLAGLVACGVMLVSSARQTRRSMQASLPVGSHLAIEEAVDGFSVTARTGETTVAFDSIKEARVIGDALLLRLGTNVLHVFPRTAADDDLLQRILASVD